jgi:hypothetical protein
MACCKKPAAKKVAVKDVATKKNPKGGMTKADRPALIASPLNTTMGETVNRKLGSWKRARAQRRRRMAKKAAKPVAKKPAVKTKDLETKKNPKGGEARRRVL